MDPYRFDAKGDCQSAYDYIRATLATQGFAIVSGISTELSVLQPLFSRFGEVLERRFKDINLSGPQYFGDVRYRNDISSEERKSTQGDEALEFHTAHAFEASRPRFFAMAMINEGWRGEHDDCLGETKLLSFDNIAAHILSEQDGQAGQSSIEALSTTSVSFAPPYIRPPLSDLPLLELRNGTYYGRCWEKFRESIPGIKTLRGDDRFPSAAGCFATALETTKSFLQFPLHSGEILAIDNWRFAHGRTAFNGSRFVAGIQQTNPRQIRSIHVVCQSF